MWLACSAATSQAGSWLVDPAGRQARVVADQTWILGGLCTLIYLVVVAVFLAGLGRGTIRARSQAIAPEIFRRAHRAVVGASVLVVFLLFAILVLDLVTRRSLAAITWASSTPSPRTLHVTGHQFWWQVRYPDPGDGDGDGTIETANEIHVPVGTPILLELESADVIHSFWVPTLAGKADLVPGYETTLWLRADRTGVHVGQCAEFCGRQHAGMGIRVIAEREDDFERWLEGQAQPARAPRSAEAKKGREVFLASSCIGCHAVRGTPARGRTGPDLTHLASRDTLGAALLPNDEETLRAWIEDPQEHKPGNLMPPSELGPEEIEAVVAYLQSLE